MPVSFRLRHGGRVLACVALALLPASHARAATLTVCASGCTYTTPQAAIDAAQPGDTILLRAGETFVGHLMLRAKPTPSTGPRYIVIRSDAPATALPPAGVRLVPQGRPGANTALSALARILGTGGANLSVPILRAEAGAHHYILQFIDFDGAAQLGYQTLIAFGTDKAQPSPPHHITLDRVYVHGHRTKGQKAGIALNANAIDVIDSYISDIKAVNADSQAIGGWNGAGPFKIINNYIEGAAENVLFGGAVPASTGLIPSDIEIRRNHITKPTAWRNPILASPTGVNAARSSGGGALGNGTHYFKVVAVLKAGPATAVSLPSAEVAVTVAAGDRVSLSWSAVSGAEMYRVYRGPSPGGELVYTQTPGAAASFVYTGSGEVSGLPPTKGTKWVSKNLLELKNAQRLTLDGNVIEHNWAGDQAGYAIMLTPRNVDNLAPWAAVRDITITNNTIRHAAGAINILGYDDTRSLTSALSERITVRNNLIYEINPAKWGGGYTKCFIIGQGASQLTFDRNTILHATNALVWGYGDPMPKFVFTNNAALHGTYGVMGDSSSPGNTALATYFPGAVFAYNVLAGGKASLYPPNNWFPTLAEWNASFVDPASGDYRILTTSPFYNKGSGGTVPGADFAALEKAQGIESSTPTIPPPPSSNGVPTADAGGPYSVLFGASLTVDGTGSSDPENGIASYLWSWGDEIVIHASDVPTASIHGNWQKAPVSGAAGGIALVNPNKGVAKIATPLASPSSYVDITFNAASGVPYYVWFRMQAESNSYSNDSVYVQFSGARDASGNALARIGTPTALSLILEQGRDLGVSGWGWTDSAYDGTALPVYFATSGPQTLRLQPREDGVRIDQIVISSSAYAAKMPGLTKADTKIVSRSLGTSTGVHASHVYARRGVYPLTLLVTDTAGASDKDGSTVTVK